MNYSEKSLKNFISKMKEQQLSFITETPKNSTKDFLLNNKFNPNYNFSEKP